MEKAGFVYAQLPNIAAKYGLRAGDGSEDDQKEVEMWRQFENLHPDKENATALKFGGVGNCGEWS